MSIVSVHNGGRLPLDSAALIAQEYGYSAGCAGISPETGGQFSPEDTLDISPEGREKSGRNNPRAIEGTENTEKEKTPGEETDSSKKAGIESDESKLSDAEQRKIDELSKRDQKVRAHEQAHLSAAGGLARSGASLKYERGPDGKQYAVGGEVNLSAQDAPTPEEDLRIARQLERAALAPAEPSSQDRKVAEQARRKAVQAQRELMEKNTKESRGEAGAPQSNMKSEAEFQAQTDNSQAIHTDTKNINRIDWKRDAEDEGKAPRHIVNDSNDPRRPSSIANRNGIKSQEPAGINGLTEAEDSQELIASESPTAIPQFEANTGEYRLDSHRSLTFDLRI